MSRVLLCVLVALAVLAQLAIVPVFLASSAAPFLPLALIGGWGAVRGASEVIPALPVVAVPFGVASEERVGWYLLACLPLVVFLLVAPRRATRAPLCVVAGAAAGAGGALYPVLLLIVAGRVGSLQAEAVSVALGSLVTGGLGGLVATCIWPWRSATRSLFG